MGPPGEMTCTQCGGRSVYTNMPELRTKKCLGCLGQKVGVFKRGVKCPGWGLFKHADHNLAIAYSAKSKKKEWEPDWWQCVLPGNVPPSGTFEPVWPEVGQPA